MAETAKINLEYETKTAEIKRQTALEIASIPVNASDEYKESREAEILANAAAQEAAATSQKDNALGLLDIQTQISAQLVAQTEQMQLMSDLSNSMNVVFGERLGTIGKIFEIEQENSIALAKAREGEKEAEENFFKIAADKKSTQADIDKAREIANKATLKTQKTELDGNIKLVSGAKTLFKEKSAGYKILEACIS